MPSCFLTTFGTQNNYYSYHDQSLIILSCGETIVQIYPIVVRKFNVKLRVAFPFAYSIYTLIAMQMVFNF